MDQYDFRRVIESALEIGAVDDVKLISLKQIQSKDGNNNLFLLAVEVRHKKPEPEQKPECECL